MQLADYYKHGLLEVRASKNYVFVCCPKMDGDLSFSEKRMAYRHLKELEESLSGVYKEIVAYTRLKSSHMMIMFAKLGYNPFHLSIKRKVLWFKKEL